MIKLQWIYFIYTACELNTYGDKRGYAKECRACPANSGTSHLRPGEIAVTLSDCQCGKGYRGTIRFPGDKCTRKLVYAFISLLLCVYILLPNSYNLILHKPSYSWKELTVKRH